MTWKYSSVNIQPTVRSLGLVLTNRDSCGVFGAELRIKAMECRNLPWGLLRCGRLPLPLISVLSPSRRPPSTSISTSFSLPAHGLCMCFAICKSPGHHSDITAQMAFPSLQTRLGPLVLLLLVVCCIFPSHHLSKFVISPFWSVVFNVISSPTDCKPLKSRTHVYSHSSLSSQHSA